MDMVVSVWKPHAGYRFHVPDFHGIVPQDLIETLAWVHEFRSSQIRHAGRMYQLFFSTVHGRLVGLAHQ